jgi:uncharacterized damage-inducible protein DinB
MSETDRDVARLETQLRLSFEGAAWHGPSVLEALEGVTPGVAHAHPVAGGHSIWELVLHLTSTYRLVLRRLEGDAIQLTPSEDWPQVPAPTPANWEAAIRTLTEVNEALRRAVRGFDPARLDEPLVAEPPYTAYTQFIGITQHDLYHAGQMVMIKRAQRSATARDTRTG